jgi:O-antigen ligase
VIWFARMRHVDSTEPSIVRRLIVPLVLLVPWVIDPYGIDTLAVERMALALIGLLLLGLEAGEALFLRRSLLSLAAPEALLLALAGWSAVSMLWATNRVLSLASLVGLLGMLGVARTVRAAVSGTANARKWIVALVSVGMGAIAVDAVAVWQRTDDLGEGASKYASLLFEHNNMAADYAVMLLPLAAVLLLAGPGLRRVLGSSVIVACIGYVALLRSRSGVIAIVLGLGLVLLLSLMRKKIIGLKPKGNVLSFKVIVMLIVLGALPFSDGARGVAKDTYYRVINVLEQYGISNIQDSGFRGDLYSKTVQMAKTVPFSGVGAGNWSVEYPRYERFIQERPHAHNDILQVLSELGLPGLALFLGLLCSLAVTQWRVMTGAKSPGAFACGAGLFGCLAVFVMTGLFEVPFTIGATGSVLAVVLGLSTRLGETGGRAVGTFRPAKLLSVGVVLVCLGGCAYIARRLPATRLLAQSQALAETGDMQAAIARLAPVTEMLTGSYVPERTLGRMELGQGHGEAALVHFRVARQMSPHNLDLRLDEGEALVDVERYEEAVDCFEQALADAPGDERAYTSLITALDRAGRLPEAIDLLEYKLQSELRTVSLNLTLRTAQLWRRLGDEREGESRVQARVASRHFYAVFLEDGPVENWAATQKEFKHMTHLLQVAHDGEPNDWWPVYDRFLKQGNWHMPATSLWTALDEDGVKLFPGWKQPAGPPRPRDMRDQP